MMRVERLDDATSAHDQGGRVTGVHPPPHAGAGVQLADDRRDELRPTELRGQVLVHRPGRVEQVQAGPPRVAQRADRDR